MAPFFGNFAAALATMQPASQQQQRLKDQAAQNTLPAAVSAAINAPSPGKVIAAAPSEPGKIVMYSPEYYYTCAIGGVASCGLTHTAVTPLDVVKCNMQTDPAKYKSIRTGFGTILKEQGAAGLMRGWLPTLLGYSAQGAFKFGLVRARERTLGCRRRRCCLAPPRRACVRGVHSSSRACRPAAGPAPAAAGRDAMPRNPQTPPAPCARRHAPPHPPPQPLPRNPPPTRPAVRVLQEDVR
jgi:hypothetical protein